MKTIKPKVWIPLLFLCLLVSIGAVLMFLTLFTSELAEPEWLSRAVLIAATVILGRFAIGLWKEFFTMVKAGPKYFE